MELTDDAYCFVCGKANELGLRIDWKTEGKTTRALVRLPKVFQGWKDLVHGGILAAILDEAMTRLAWQVHGSAVTAEITVRYLQPAKIGETLTVNGSIEEPSGRLILASSEIRNEKNQLVATATGKILKPKSA